MQDKRRSLASNVKLRYVLSLDRLRALDALARTGTVGRAATELHLTPSAVSQQLAKLDREAGAALTEPAGRGLRLTHAGRVLAEHARDVLARLATAEADLGRLDVDVAGPLRIGAIPTTLHALAPAALARLTARHPRLRISLTDGEAEETLPRVVADELDLAVVESWDGSPAPRPAGTTRTVLHHDVVDLLLPAAHPLAARDEIDLAETGPAGLDWVADRMENRTGRWLVATLRAVNVEPRVTCTVCGFTIHVELVAGAGVAALVPRLARVVPPGVRVVATRPRLHRTIDAVWRTGHETPAVRAAVAELTAVAREWVPQASGASSWSASKQV